MDDLCFKIDIVLNECSRVLSIVEGEEIHKSYNKAIFKNFVNGPLLQFVKSIHFFLKISKCKNIYMIYVCLSQIRKCLLIHESTILEQNNINIEKVLNTYLIKRIQKCFYKLEDYMEMLDISGIDEHPGIFIDRMNIVLNGLNNRNNFELIKSNIDKILFQAIIIAKISDNIDSQEITSSSKYVLKAIQHFENVNESDSFIKFDYLSSLLSILERRINTTVLHLITKIFNDPYCIIKNLIRKCGESVDNHLKNSSDLSDMISKLDKFTDVLIQIGLFAIACCKNNDYVIPLKCCISSLELLDSDMVPTIIEFYLDPTSIVKKTFLKILVNHWVNEICEMQSILDKIVDPFTFTEVTLETFINIMEIICKSDPKTNVDLYKNILNSSVNFTKYIEKIFAFEVSRETELSKSYKQFKDALKEFKACFIFNKKTNLDYNESLNKKLFKRCEILTKYLKNLQVLIGNITNNTNTNQFESSEIENNNYIFSKTIHTPNTSMNSLQNDNIEDNDWDYMFSSIQVKKSFYNKSERKISNQIYHPNNFSSTDETIYGNTVTMDLTNNYIEILNTSDNKNTVNIWEEVCDDTPTKVCYDIEEVDNKIKNVNL